MFNKIKGIVLAIWDIKVEIAFAFIFTVAFVLSLIITPWIGVVMTGVVAAFAIWLLVLVIKGDV